MRAGNSFLFSVSLQNIVLELKPKPYYKCIKFAMIKLFNFSAAFLLLYSIEACNTEHPVLLQEMDNTGIDFQNKTVNTSEFNIFSYRNFYNGGGVAIGDLNNDGLSDVFFTANMGANKLYLNKGNWQFEDISETAGFRNKQKWSTGVALVDINQDGFLDIYVCNAGYQPGVNTENELWINDGQMHFTDQAAKYGLNDSGFTTHAAFFDYDMDGDLDCYILNNSFIPVNTLNYSNKRELRAKDWNVAEELKGGGDKLMRNDGGVFTDVSEEAGIYGSLIGFGLGVTVGDVNGDLLPDIYVSNDFFERDYLYINQGNGKFNEELTKRVRHLSHSSMGADMADVNNDGLNDLFVTEMLPDDDKRLKITTSFESYDVFKYKVKSDFYYQYMQNTLQKNNGRGMFSDVAHYAGVSASDWSWGALLFDADNDGLNDIYVCNGIYHDLTDQDFIDFFADEVVQRMVVTGKKEEVEEVIKKMPSRPIKNKFYLNKGSFSFADAGDSTGVTTASFSNGAAYGDLDNDGDLDLIVNNLNQPAFVYRNNSRELTGNHYIGFKLESKAPNRNAVGAKVAIYRGEQVQVKELLPTRGFQSSVDTKILFGLGKDTHMDSIRVYWPDRTFSTLKGLRADSVYHLKPQAADHKFVPETEAAPLFAVNEQVQLDSHVEDNYVDIYQERNIPRLLSHEGPRAAVADVNADGKDDIFIGGATGKPAALYVQTVNGFKPSNVQLWQQEREHEDVAAVFFDADGDRDLDLFVGSGGNNRPTSSKAMSHRLYLNDGKGNFSKHADAFPPAIGNTNVVLTVDIDQDGDQDLFTASCSVPVQYGPMPAPAFYINDGRGSFKEDEKILSAVKPGMITAAILSDLDGKGLPELVLVGEWMSPAIYTYEQGRFVPFSEINNSHSGWWHAIAAADLDQDGDQDLILGNMGANNYLRPTESSPVKMWVNQYDQSANRQVILTRTVGGKDVPVFLKKELTDQIPSLKKQNLRHDAYANKSVQELFSKELIESSQVHTYNYSTSCIAWNKGGGKFDYTPLPLDVQVSAVTAILPADVNQDGKMDLLFGFNLYDWLPQFSRMDAGYGLLLLNEGGRQFKSLRPAESGIEIIGETRDIQPVNLMGQQHYLFVQNNDVPLLFQHKLKK
jgi:hypothetical protein